MHWRYDPDGQRVALIHPGGSETTYTRDAGGLVIAIAHPGLGTIRLDRDPAGRLVAASADGMRARWRYVDGELAEYELLADDRHRTEQLTRDDAGRATSTSQDGTPRRLTYDAAGQLVSVDGPDGLLVFTYDANGRLTAESSGGDVTEYEYDAAGQLVTRQRGDLVTSFEYDPAGRRVRETAPDMVRSLSWDRLGRIRAISTSAPGETQEQTIDIEVDALGELAAVDGTALLWDTADPLAPLSQIGEQVAIGQDSPWALTGPDGTKWLAPDWQGTVGGARDPWGATTAGDAVALGLGFRGQVEVAGLIWLRHRVYDPASRAFLTADPLAPMPGTAWAANPYHYAANNPIGLSDPLGLRPVTEEELQAYRDEISQGLVQFVGENWVAAVAIVGGIALMCTGIGGPVGLALMAASGALTAGGMTLNSQVVSGGELDWGEVIGDAVWGAGIGIVTGAAFGPMFNASRVLGEGVLVTLGRGAVTGATLDVTVNAGARAIRGEDPFARDEMLADMLLGGVSGMAGTLHVEPDPPPYSGSVPRSEPAPSSVASLEEMLSRTPGLPTGRHRLGELPTGRHRMAY